MSSLTILQTEIEKLVIEIEIDLWKKINFHYNPVDKINHALSYVSEEHMCYGKAFLNSHELKKHLECKVAIRLIRKIVREALIQEK